MQEQYGLLFWMNELFSILSESHLLYPYQHKFQYYKMNVLFILTNTSTKLNITLMKRIK